MATTDDWDPVETLHNALDPRPAVPAQPHGWAGQGADTGGALPDIPLSARQSVCVPGPHAPQLHGPQDTPHAPLQQPLREASKWGGARCDTDARVAHAGLSNSVTFSGSAKDFIRFTLANGAFSFPQGSAMAEREMPFSAGGLRTPNASRVLSPSAGSAGASTDG